VNIDVDNTPLAFPCDYPVKVMGRSTADFRVRMLQVMAVHVGQLDAARIAERLSRDGNYTSLTVLVRADSREMLERLYRDLHATGLVLYAL
jgi:putative lipoic acid-binding regulatory protein